MSSLIVTIAPTCAILAQTPSFSSNLANEGNSSIILAREYTFKAPDRKIFTNTEQLKAAQGYRVEVYNVDGKLLLQVQDIEPKAFAKGDIIQVGIFKRQKNAEDLVRKLAIEGLWARIVPQ
jgi:hypothetical protein